MTTKHVALITGASAGLGEQFASLFAKDGHDVILVARNKSRLEEIARKLAVHKVDVRVLAEDLSKPGAGERVHAWVKSKGLAVDCLVNNAGFGSTGAYLDLPVDKEVEMITLNCTTLAELCHRFGADMRAQKQGKILNIASSAGFQPGPFMATYYATKAFVVSFSEALAHELSGSGVTVTCHCPGPTATEFSSRAGNADSALFKRTSVATSESVASDAYEAMMRGDVLAVHGFMNWMGVQLIPFLPRAMVRKITAQLNSRA
jgi:uncharacterized protein